MLNKSNRSFKLITKCKILLNVFIVATNFVLYSIHHVVDDSFDDVLVDVENNLSFAHKLRNKMRFDWIFEYDKHIGEKLFAIKIAMDYVIFQPLRSMLGVHMVLNIVVTKRGKPSLHFSRGLVLGANLLFLTECNTKTTL